MSSNNSLLTILKNKILLKINFNKTILNNANNRSKAFNKMIKISRIYQFNHKNLKKISFNKFSKILKIFNHNKRYYKINFKILTKMNNLKIFKCKKYFKIKLKIQILKNYLNCF